MSVAGGDDEDVCACLLVGDILLQYMIKDMINLLYLHDLYNSFDLTIEHNIISVIDPRYSVYNQFYIAGHIMVVKFYLYSRGIHLLGRIR